MSARRSFRHLCVLILLASCGDPGTGTGSDGGPSDGTTTDGSGFPSESTTGVPNGVALTTYSTPCTLQASTTLDAVDATACDAIVIQAGDVVITRSLLPRVEATVESGSYSVTISDSTVQAGEWQGGASWGNHITATRVEVTGGQHSFHCGDNCIVRDSWLHDQWNPDGESFHNNAFISNGGSNMEVTHNTVLGTPLLNSTDGGCTADLSLFGDFGPIANVKVTNNLMKANNSSISYCAYGGYSPSKAYPIATGIEYADNVFERGANGKCGVYGPVTSFQLSATGNVWSNNRFDDGTVVDAAE
jgi:hypothetical protein